MELGLVSVFIYTQCCHEPSSLRYTCEVESLGHGVGFSNICVHMKSPGDPKMLIASSRSEAGSGILQF